MLKSILNFFLAFPHLLVAQRTCLHGACYPPVQDLLIGRIHYLKASSTCGLTQPETSCTPYGEWQMKCCVCDSRTPHAFNSHQVENVLSSTGHKRWWQSQNDVKHVSLQLDLNNTFQLANLLLDFRSPLPGGMVIERSTDFGTTWKIYQYLSTDCSTIFPWILKGLPQKWQDVRCQDIQSQPRQPQNGGKVLKMQYCLDLTSGMRTSKSQRINNLAEFTNLRINFTQLTRFPHQGYRLPSAFYALNEMQVQGSCFCHGHADRCAAPDASSGEPRAMVHGRCVCQHNTAGPNCDHCASFYNDQPWRPAEDDNPNECCRCNCNGHSHKCHFDQSVYQANGGKSGGVCEDCQHNTEGRNCEFCKINFFRNRRFDLGHPEVCLPCECDPDGTVPESSCDRMNGRCVCKDNVQGDRCHLCKPGFTQLTNSNPQGCRECACNILGSRRNVPCDDETGRCFCLSNVVGEKCDECAVNHWKIASGEGCWPCNCHPQNSLSLQCNQFTGQCQCREGYGGLTCSTVEVQECPHQTFGNVRTGCRACDCNFQGTEVMGCNKLTGSCLCRSGFTGPQCNQCQRGYCGNYHQCETCHPCFQAYDDDIQRFGLRQAALKNSTQYFQGETMTTGYSIRLLEVERKMQHIQHILDNSLITEQGLDQVANNIATIRSAHLTSSNASARIAGSSGLLAESLEYRRNAEELESRLTDPDSGFEVLQNKMAVTPNLTPVINKICSVVRSEVCTPSDCIGYLCPHQNANECGPGLSCKGIIALSSSSIQTARKNMQEFRNFNSQLQDTEQMIRAAEITSSKIQTNAQNLRNQMSAIRTQIEADIQRTKQFIRQVRNFLSDPDADITTIQQVSNYILSLNLPIDTGTILRKITEIQNLIAKLQCPDSIIAQTAGDIAKAKYLQQEAEEAGNQASTIEGNVEDVLQKLKQGQIALQEAELTIHDSAFPLQRIQNRLDEIQTILTPAQENVRDITSQLDSFTEMLVQLQYKASQNQLLAADAHQQATEAHAQAKNTQQVFLQLNGKYMDLKRRMGQGSNLGIQGDRIQTAHTEANTLLNEALNMMAKMAALETELQESNNAFILKSDRLKGLDKKVETIRDYISRQVAYYASCTN
uniref:Laminin subunit beta 3 n=1 Tax=Pseudonaja textilis TaxID=8673 RepID=A0A670YBI5_PSETE